MIRTLRHATALTDHREHERLDQSLLQSVTDLAAGPGGRGPGTPGASAIAAQLWRLVGPQDEALLVLAASTVLSPASGDERTAAEPSGGHQLPHPWALQPMMQVVHERAVRSAPRHGPGLAGSWCTWLPVERHGRVLAVLEIVSPQALPAARLNIVQGMCSLYANHLSLLHDSQVDTLTQLLNRKTFDDSIQRLLSSARRSACPTWVAVIDIDHFKRINDGYGHLFGDEVLLLVAGMLRRGFRHQDKVFRFGGEEFVVLLKDLDSDGAQAALERLRLTIECHRFPQVGQVTVSIGATAIVAGDAACDALGRADHALYHAKSSGRNQLWLFENLKAQGDSAPAVTLHGEVDLF